MLSRISILGMAHNYIYTK